MARILFIDLNDHRALQTVLQGLGHQVFREERTVLSSVDVVFCNAAYQEFALIVQSVKLLRPPVPVIAVTLVSNSARALAALEAGADNYCNSAADAGQLRRILEGVGIPSPAKKQLCYQCQTA